MRLIRPGKFAIAYVLYTVVTFLICMMVNTIAAAIIYIFLLLPFNLLCVAYVISLAATNRSRYFRIRLKYFLIPMFFQGLMFLTSPASCYGFKQGESCYSLIQTFYISLFTSANLQSFDIKIDPWQWAEAAFFITLPIYAVTMIVFLATIQPSPSTANSHDAKS